VERNEESINEIKASLRSFLAGLARTALTNRQALLAQSLNRCAVEVERIGDHVDRLRELITAAPAAQFDPQLRVEIAGLADRVFEVVGLVEQSFSSEDLNFDAPSWAILEARNRYRNECTPVKTAVTERLSRREVPPGVALAFSEIVTTLDRIARHCAVIAQEQRQPGFAIKRERLGQSPGE
jgi:Na+/phosphate symporter